PLSETADYTDADRMCQAMERVKPGGEVDAWSENSPHQIPNAEADSHQRQEKKHQHTSNDKFKLSITILIGRGKRALWKIWWRCVRGHFLTFNSFRSRRLRAHCWRSFASL